MAITPLNFEHLKDLDGGMLNIAANDSFANAVKDCQYRTNVTKAREVTIKIFITPKVVDKTGSLEQVEISYGLDEKFPPRRSGKTTAGVKHNGSLYFNELSPGNPDQRTIDEVGG
jgi:hypothetical protein